MEEKELKGKRLLIMGANPETTPLVKLANEMGIESLQIYSLSRNAKWGVSA